MASNSDVWPTPGSPSTRPVFPTSTPRCAEASHETPLQPHQRGLVTLAAWVKPGVIRSGLLDDGAHETSVGGWRFGAGLADWKLARFSESWFVITLWRGRLTHLGWLLVSISQHSCNPAWPSLPRLPPRREHDKHRGALEEYPWDAPLLTDGLAGKSWVCSSASALPGLYLTLLRLSHIVTLTHLRRNAQNAKNYTQTFRNQLRFELRCIKLNQSQPGGDEKHWV